MYECIWKHFHPCLHITVACVFFKGTLISKIVLNENIRREDLLQLYMYML